jgi:phosphatidate cytidylyltransferase
MELGIENEALAWAAPTMLGFMAFMIGLLILFTAVRYQKSKETLDNIWLRVVVAVPLLFVIFGSMEFGPMAWGALIGAFALASHREYQLGIGKADSPMRWVGSTVLVLMMVAAMTHNRLPFAGEGQLWIGLGLLVALIGIWLVPLVQDRAEGVMEDVGRAMIGFTLGWLFLHGGFLLHLGPVGTGACIFAVINVAMTDTFALLTGRIFGKHPFRPTLSPKKTWEGVFGGILFAGIAGYAMQPLIPALSALETGLLGAVLAIMGTMGDLMLSAMKRDLGIKDWSATLPGHGGILDRVDSFMFVAPSLYWILFFIGA